MFFFDCSDILYDHQKQLSNENSKGGVDGGLVANNPSVAALIYALSEKFGNQEAVNIRLFSIGTGTTPETEKEFRIVDVGAAKMEIA